MSQVVAAAQQAILDGGIPALITLGGGSLQVRLYRDGVEVSGNGYARQTISSSVAATDDTLGAGKSFDPVTFTATGGNIVYDQVRAYNAAGSTLYLASDIGPDLTITPAEAHVVTLRAQIPDNNLPLRTAAEIQAALDNMVTSRMPALVAATRIPVASQINWTGATTTAARVGGRLIGEGATERTTDAYDALSSRLYWTGTRGPSETTAMIRSTMADIKMEGLALEGDTDANILAASQRGPCALEMDRMTTGADIGSGKWDLRDISFCHWLTGLRLATATGDGNCDESDYWRLFFDRCDVGVELNGFQTLDHHFYNPRFRNTTKAFKINAGGALAVHDGLVTQPGSFLHFPASAKDNFGQNSCGYTIDGHLKIDSQATGLKLIDQEPITTAGYYSTFNFHGVHIPSPQLGGVEKPYWSTDDGTNINDIDPLVMLSGNSALNWWGPLNLQRGMIAWDCGASGRITIMVIGARIIYPSGATALSAISQVCNLAKSRGTAHVILAHCRDYNTLTPYATFDGTLTGLL